MHFVYLNFQSDLLSSMTKLLCQHSGTQILCTWDIITVAFYWFTSHFHRKSNMFCLC